MHLAAKESNRQRQHTQAKKSIDKLFCQKFTQCSHIDADNTYM